MPATVVDAAAVSWLAKAVQPPLVNTLYAPTALALVVKARFMVVPNAEKVSLAEAPRSPRLAPNPNAPTNPAPGYLTPASNSAGSLSAVALVKCMPASADLVAPV